MHRGGDLIKSSYGRKKSLLVIAALVSTKCSIVHAQQSVDDLSKAAANPLAPVISVPITQDFNFQGGDRSNSFSYLANIEPVIPFQLDDQWNLITRLIVPIAYNNYTPDKSTAGLGDINASFFLSPAQPGAGGVLWGIGPALLVPTATNSSLGTGQWGAGPTGVALVQKNGWTAGALVSHVWSLSSKHDREGFSVSQIEPFLSYDFGGGRSLNLTVESTYDWKHENWTVPVNLSASKVFNIGNQAMSFEIGGKYYAEAPRGSPKWGIRTGITFFFPE
ncbi:hypothetical protein ACI0FR_03263 [Paenochrobactrum sp. BZR 201-1]